MRMGPLPTPRLARVTLGTHPTLVSAQVSSSPKWALTPPRSPRPARRGAGATAHASVPHTVCGTGASQCTRQRDLSVWEQAGTVAPLISRTSRSNSCGQASTRRAPQPRGQRSPCHRSARLPYGGFLGAVSSGTWHGCAGTGWTARRRGEPGPPAYSSLGWIDAPPLVAQQRVDTNQGLARTTQQMAQQNDVLRRFFF